MIDGNGQQAYEDYYNEEIGSMCLKVTVIL